MVIKELIQDTNYFKSNSVRVSRSGLRVWSPGFRIRGFTEMCSGSEAGSYKAHRLCVSLNPRLESNKEEEKKVEVRVHSVDYEGFGTPNFGGQRDQICTT